MAAPKYKELEVETVDENELVLTFKTEDGGSFALSLTPDDAEDIADTLDALLDDDDSEDEEDED
jgi:hypothetical protein